jgi:hypothetical protein
VSDEARQLTKAAIAASVCGAVAGVATYALMQFASGGAGRIILLCAGATGLAVPKVTERITGVCGPIMWLPVVVGGLAAGLVLSVAFMALGGWIAPVTLALACLVYLLLGGAGIMMESS